jgi:hypothetical protein
VGTLHSEWASTRMALSWRAWQSISIPPQNGSAGWNSFANWSSWMPPRYWGSFARPCKLGCQLAETHSEYIPMSTPEIYILHLLFNNVGCIHTQTPNHKAFSAEMVLANIGAWVWYRTASSKERRKEEDAPLTMHQMSTRARVHQSKIIPRKY